MNTLSFFCSSLFLSINRYIGKIGGVAMIMILGHYDTNVVAAFSLLLAGISIFFMAAIAGQMGLQSEFARLRAQNKDSAGLLAGSIMLFGGLAGILYLVISIIGADYFIGGNDPIFESARQSFGLLTVSIPLLALNNICAMFLEGHGRAAVVSIVRIGQVLCGIIAVASIALLLELSLFKVILVYVVLDATALCVLGLYIHKKQLVSFLHLSFNNIKQVFRPFTIGAPAALCQAATSFATFQLTSLVTGLGAPAAIALSTIISLTLLLQIPIMGVSQQVGLEVAKQHSLKQPIWPSMKKGSMTILIILSIGILAIFLNRSTLGLMVAHDATSQMIFVESIASVILFIIASIVSLYLLNLLRSCGDYVIPQVIATLCGALGFAAWVIWVKQPIAFVETINTYIAFSALSSLILLGRLLYLNIKVKNSNA